MKLSRPIIAAGVNDDVEHAKELAELLHQWGPGYHVNLIPFNPIDGTEYKRPYRKAVHVSFRNIFIVSYCKVFRLFKKRLAIFYG